MSDDDEAIIRGLQAQSRKDLEENTRLRERIVNLEGEIKTLKLRLETVAATEKEKPSRRSRGPYDLEGDPYQGG